MEIALKKATQKKAVEEVRLCAGERREFAVEKVKNRFTEAR